MFPTVGQMKEINQLKIIIRVRYSEWCQQENLKTFVFKKDVHYAQQEEQWKNNVWRKKLWQIFYYVNLFLVEKRWRLSAKRPAELYAHTHIHCLTDRKKPCYSPLCVPVSQRTHEGTALARVHLLKLWLKRDSFWVTITRSLHGGFLYRRDRITAASSLPSAGFQRGGE